MASALVDVVVGKLGGMIIGQMNKEVSLVCHFRNDFQWLSMKLTNISGYLRDADVQSAQNASVKSWLLDVADIACDAEDIPGELKLVGDVTHADQPSTSTPQNLKWRGSNVIETGSRPVTIESKVQDVIRLLDDPAAPVIAVVSMGGVGKTFLLQNAFDRAKGRFEQSVWLAISQTYSLEKLQAALASKIGVNEVLTGRIDEVQAAQLIHERLTSTTGRSLIVLDDVWRATGQDNLISAFGLPTGDDTHCKLLSPQGADMCAET
ncbi:hypothetical protein SUGI_0366830 [Cryptomeria japonica]|nr:hypothetical protein SUGI_0366830 [Cryptomeria japonica]